MIARPNGPGAYLRNCPGYLEGAPQFSTEREERPHGRPCGLSQGEQADAILLDFHTEATSEIQAMGHFLDGKVSLVVGTHTHIPTSDHRILRGGTALMADAGMCGDFDSIIGTESDEPLNRFLTGIPNGRFSPAEGEATLCGVAVQTDPRTGLALKVLPVRIGGSLAQALPEF